MSETYLMLSQKDEYVFSYTDVPVFVIEKDKESTGMTDYVQECAQIKKMYSIFENGADFLSEGTNGDYIASDLCFKKAASSIKKEARFLFANPPTFNINLDDVNDEFAAENTILQNFLEMVLEKNKFNVALIKAAKDCFIGKRVAIALNFNNDGISIVFFNALQFLYKMDGVGELEKFVTFVEITSDSERSVQRWHKKVFEIVDGSVYVEEKLYDGLGNVVEDTLKRKKIALDYIPAVVILNDGLTGDKRGVSEIDSLGDFESVYNKISNADIDAGRKSMNATRVVIDASEESTAKLSSAPGALWDLTSDGAGVNENVSAKALLLEPQMSYSSALKNTLERIENSMYFEIDLPNLSAEQLKGVITSGKTLRALYWPLIVRCDEKMLTWGPELKKIANAIIDGAKAYPKSIKKYTSVSVLPEIEYKIEVVNNYPLPADVAEEKEQDLNEVAANVMSRKAYLKKWRDLSDKGAEEELLQIKREQDLFDNSVLPPDYDNTNVLDSEAEPAGEQEEFDGLTGGDNAEE